MHALPCPSIVPKLHHQPFCRYCCSCTNPVPKHAPHTYNILPHQSAHQSPSIYSLLHPSPVQPPQLELQQPGIFPDPLLCCWPCCAAFGQVAHRAAVRAERKLAASINASATAVQNKVEGPAATANGGGGGGTRVMIIGVYCCFAAAAWCCHACCTCRHTSNALKQHSHKGRHSLLKAQPDATQSLRSQTPQPHTAPMGVSPCSRCFRATLCQCLTGQSHLQHNSRCIESAVLPL